MTNKQESVIIRGGFGSMEFIQVCIMCMCMCSLHRSSVCDLRGVVVVTFDKNWC